MSREFQCGKGSYFCFGPTLLRNDPSFDSHAAAEWKQGPPRSAMTARGVQASYHSTAGLRPGAC